MKDGCKRVKENRGRPIGDRQHEERRKRKREFGKGRKERACRRVARQGGIENGVESGEAVENQRTATPHRDGSGSQSSAHLRSVRVSCSVVNRPLPVPSVESSDLSFIDQLIPDQWCADLQPPITSSRSTTTCEFFSSQGLRVGKSSNHFFSFFASVRYFLRHFFRMSQQ